MSDSLRRIAILSRKSLVFPFFVAGVPHLTLIFELGYFIGRIGRERVTALHEANNNLELPSDYSG